MSSIAPETSLQVKQVDRKKHIKTTLISLATRLKTLPRLTQRSVKHGDDFYVTPSAQVFLSSDERRFFEVKKELGWTVPNTNVKKFSHLFNRGSGTAGQTADRECVTNQNIPEGRVISAIVKMGHGIFLPL